MMPETLPVSWFDFWNANVSAWLPPVRLPTWTKLASGVFGWSARASEPSFGLEIVQAMLTSGPTRVLEPRPPSMMPVTLPPARSVNVSSPAPPVRFLKPAKPRVLPPLAYWLVF